MKTPKQYLKSKDDYFVVKVLLEKGEITRFKDIFSYTAKTRMAGMLKMALPTLTRLIKDPSKLTIWQIGEIADLINVDHLLLINLIWKDVEAAKKRAAIAAKKKKK